MKRILSWIVVALLCLPLSAPHAISLHNRNADGTFDALYPLDDKPLAPPSGDYTERCIGTNFTACETSEAIVASGDATIQTNLSNRRTGLTGISYTVATGIDGKVKADIESVAGSNTYRAGGVAIFADDAGTPDYENGVRCQQPATSGQSVRLIPIIAGVQGTVQYSGSTDTDLPELLAAQYDYSTGMAQCLEWNTAEAEWDLVGEYALNLTAPYYLSLSAESDSPAGSSSTATFDDAVFNNTLETIGDDSPPPDPDPDPTSGAGSYPDPVLGTTMLGGRTSANCTNAACIQSNLICGRTITLTANIAAAVSISSSCAANNPVYIEGAGFEAQGQWTTTTASARVIIKGVKLTATTTQFQFGGTNNKLLANEFTGWGTAGGGAAYAICTYDGADGEIGYNWFHDPGAWGPNGGNNLRIAIRTCEQSAADFQTGVWEHHNLFSDFPDKPIPADYGSGQNDVTEVCSSSTDAYSATLDTGWWIERNLILRHLQGGGVGAATIDLKCGGGFVVRYNTFTSSNGRLDIRGGNAAADGSWVEGNTNSKGYNVHGSSHKLLGNSGTMTLRAGANECTAPITTGSHHARTCNVLIEGGFGTINVGSTAGPGPYLASLNTTIRDRRELAFTSGGTYTIVAGNTITGATSGATAVIAAVQVTSGSFAQGNAAGSLKLVAPQTGTFQSENLNVGANSNVATISGNSACSTISLQTQSNTTNNCSSASQETYTEAFVIAESTVGPAALALASAAYRTPRLQ